MYVYNIIFSLLVFQIFNLTCLMFLLRYFGLNIKFIFYMYVSLSHIQFFVFPEFSSDSSYPWVFPIFQESLNGLPFPSRGSQARLNLHFLHLYHIGSWILYPLSPPPGKPLYILYMYSNISNNSFDNNCHKIKLFLLTQFALCFSSFFGVCSVVYSIWGRFISCHLIKIISGIIHLIMGIQSWICLLKSFSDCTAHVSRSCLIKVLPL